MNTNMPVIKGIFINSHIKALREKKGEEGVRELERRYGKPLVFKNSENVPVSEEVRIIEYVLDILSDIPVPPDKRSFEAGRLHFRNFISTPLAKIIFPIFRKNFKTLMMHTRDIAGHVFQGVKFSSEDLGPQGVKVIMENNNYPIDHFKGLFHEWLDYSGHKGTVEAAETSPNRFEYTIRWE